MSLDENGKLSSIYRAGAREEPPRWLDERILAAASREARPTLARRFVDALHGWQMPLGLAAVMVLTLSLTLTMKSENPDLISGAGVPDSQVHPDASSNAISSSAPSHELLPGQSEPMRAPAMPSRPASDLAGAPGQTASVGADVPQPPSQSARLSSGAPPSAEVVASQQVGHVRSDEPASGAPLAPAPAPAAPAAPRSPLAAPAADERPAPAALSARTRVAPRRDESLSDSKAFTAAPSEAAPAYEDDPAAWLRELAELSTQGREREVREGVRRFLARYPEHALPEILRRFR